MTPSNKEFWLFHAIYWIGAGVLLFLYGLSYDHWEVALIRNIYTPLVGFGFSFLMYFVYQNRFPAKASSKILQVLVLSLLGALVSSLLVNPVTYGLLGVSIEQLSLANLLQDGLYFLLLYLLWSILYLQLSGKNFNSTKVASINNEIESITVTKNQKNFVLPLAKITHIKANGDFVEFFTAHENYLKQGTIATYQKELASQGFERVHRSIIVNKLSIASVTGPTKGQYWITLNDQKQIRSSRSYQDIVRKLIPEAV